MRLAHPALDFAVEFRENRVPVLICENRAFFRKMITDLTVQQEGEAGEFVLSDRWEPIPISKHMLVVTDYYHPELNPKKAISQLYRELARLAEDEYHHLQTGEARTALAEWAAELCANVDAPLTYEAEPDAAALLKALDVRFDGGDGDNLQALERLMRISAGFLKTDIMALALPHEHFNAEELTLLYRTAHYNKLFLICLETEVPRSKLEGEAWYIIDRDMCTVYNENERETL